MTNSIEVYVRPAAHGPIINIHVPKGLRDRFLHALGCEGSISSAAAPISFEMTVLPEWIDEEAVDGIGPHVRVSAKNLNVIFDE